MKKTLENKKPFFARLLEEQELEQVAGGATTKYPSDSDEDQTMKYPSDGDEESASLANQTMKYPSDGDEGGI
ncbi:microviridin/marinostatin family tricyclic proteinase inhibitor [Archangium violaceum]|uniref:microviridin/marinostatin family tricyclic proteinase inhibitor n=1 Tax=Archangium violaceum TaxID=83451 RepID=UPI00194DC6DF|nr:microviridin/marinostatin family tricyclic proteinase inhibitor [Archangium violaceum]QRN95167.1 microviridin/marinostatin family tricyclic proteinase inhibitor [Archangium violaceum]